MNARHHIVFSSRLITALIIAFSIESREPGRSGEHFVLPEDIPFKSSRVLSEQEFEWRMLLGSTLKTINKKTPISEFSRWLPSTTMWDTVYLMGLIKAEKINIISSEEFDRRMEKALTTLARLPLVDGLLPNKAFSNTQTLQMVDYANNS